MWGNILASKTKGRSGEQKCQVAPLPRLCSCGRESLGGALAGPCWEPFTMGQHAHSAEIDASCLHRVSFPDGPAGLSGTITASDNLLLD